MGRGDGQREGVPGGGVSVHCGVGELRLSVEGSPRPSSAQLVYALRPRSFQKGTGSAKQ